MDERAGIVSWCNNCGEHMHAPIESCGTPARYSPYLPTPAIRVACTVK